MSKKKYLTTNELAAKLGVHRQTLWRWASDGDIPRPAKIKSRLFWDEEAIDKFMSSKGKAA